MTGIMGSPNFRPNIKSSVPALTAVCTIPVPSVTEIGMIIGSVGTTVWNVFGFAFATSATDGRASNAPSYFSPTSSFPKAVLTIFLYSFLKTASTRSFATQNSLPVVPSTSAYSILTSTATAILAGMVHGVVVQTRRYSFFFPTIGNSINTDSCTISL